MQISKIRLRGVATHTDTELDLPETGVVLVTGNNGSGKSALIEAVPLTLWGKTLRGAKLWRAEEQEQVCVWLGSKEYWRYNNGNIRCKLRWAVSDDSFAVTWIHDTTRDAQSVLNAELGTMEQWRRSCVLSSSDASNFTSVTDAERKRLIESIVGADKLEDGYREALGEFRKLEIKLTACQSDLRLAQVQAQEASKRLEDAQSISFDETPATAPDEERNQKLQEALKHTKEAAADLHQDKREAEGAVYKAKAKESIAVREATRLAQGDCPTCNQPIPPEMLSAAQALVTTAQEEAQQAEAEVASTLKGLQVELAELDFEHETLNRHILAIRDTSMRYDLWQRNRTNAANVEKATDQALQDLASAKEKSQKLHTALTSIAAQVCDQKAAVKTLSTKGVRAHLVSRVLSAIEVSANRWLSKICHGDIELSLKPTSTKADGKSLKEAVSLTISTQRAAIANKLLKADESKAVDIPSEDFRGYENASGGERRRIDIAIMFALSEVAEAAAGRSHSTLFCDEIFDALDEPGIDAVCVALRELAQDRCVVVISHNATEKLKEVAAVHVHVTDGSLQFV